MSGLEITYSSFSTRSGALDLTIHHIQLSFNSDESYVSATNMKSVIKSMDLNGKNEKELYTYDGYCDSLNVIGDQLFFRGAGNGATYNVIYALNIKDLSIEELHTCCSLCGATIFSFYVTKDNLYFPGDGAFCSANLDGSNVQDIITDCYWDAGFVVNGSYIYYLKNEPEQNDDECFTLYRCDLTGNHSEKVFQNMDYDYSPSMSYFDFTDKKILYYPPLSDDEGSRDQFISMDLDGENQTQLIQFTEDQNAGVINVNEKNIYYYLYDSESGYYICSMNLDGLNKKELSITNDKVSDLSGALNGTSFSICGNWLFAINSDENMYFEVKKYDLNEIFQ